MLNIFLIVVMLMFGWLAFIWNSKSWLNNMYKFTFILLCAWSIFLVLRQYGFIVKV